MHPRPADRPREDRGHRSTSYYPQSSTLRYDGAQRGADEYGDRRPDTRRAGQDAARAVSHQRDDRRSEPPTRDQQGRDGARKAPKDSWAPLSCARSEVQRGRRPSANTNQSAGGRPSVAQIQLNKRIKLQLAALRTSLRSYGLSTVILTPSTLRLLAVGSRRSNETPLTVPASMIAECKPFSRPLLECPRA